MYNLNQEKQKVYYRRQRFNRLDTSSLFFVFQVVNNFLIIFVKYYVYYVFITIYIFLFLLYNVNISLR